MNEAINISIYIYINITRNCQKLNVFMQFYQSSVELWH